MARAATETGAMGPWVEAGARVSVAPAVGSGGRWWRWRWRQNEPGLRRLVARDAWFPEVHESEFPHPPEQLVLATR